MWFTRVSIQNPVLATMVMLAFVVLGLFSYQRLKVDQFPDIEFPVVVVQVDYPGASPEIVETEVTKKVEEAVNSIAGINKLYSRSYDSSSVVIIEFNLNVDDRRAAEDVREKMSILRPTLRDEVKEPRVLRFDPAGRPIYTPLVGLSIMVFFALACQCLSTLAVVKRETAGYRWPLFLFAYMTALAWAMSFLVFQIGSALGF